MICGTFYILKSKKDNRNIYLGGQYIHHCTAKSDEYDTPIQQGRTSGFYVGIAFRDKNAVLRSQ